MVEPKPDPQCLPSQPSVADGGAIPSGGGWGGLLKMDRPKMRVTSEYDSESSVFFNKISCKVLDNLLKLKLNFRNDSKGEVSEPQVFLSSKCLSLQYDVAESEALLKASFEIVPGFQVRAAHDVKARQGEVTLIKNLAGPAYQLELSSAVPYIGLPRATLKLPRGQVSIEKVEEVEEELKRTFSVNWTLKSFLPNVVYSAQYSEENLALRYAYKDEQLTFIPSISVPSNAVSFAFKRRFSPSDKLSYLYHFDTNNWSAVYKHNVGKDYKLKAGYDADVQLGWASIWVGDEVGKTKTAPGKMKVQVMLQVPQCDIKSSALMFRVKKRWDI